MNSRLPPVPRAAGRALLRARWRSARPATLASAATSTEHYRLTCGGEGPHAGLPSQRQASKAARVRSTCAAILRSVARRAARGAHNVCATPQSTKASLPGDPGCSRNQCRPARVRALRTHLCPHSEASSRRGHIQKTHTHTHLKHPRANQPHHPGDVDIADDTSGTPSGMPTRAQG